MKRISSLRFITYLYFRQNGFLQKTKRKFSLNNTIITPSMYILPSCNDYMSYLTIHEGNYVLTTEQKIPDLTLGMTGVCQNVSVL